MQLFSRTGFIKIIFKCRKKKIRKFSDLNPSVTRTSKTEKEYSLCFLLLKVWERENWKRSLIIPRIGREEPFNAVYLSP